MGQQRAHPAARSPPRLQPPRGRPSCGGGACQVSPCGPERGQRKEWEAGWVAVAGGRAAGAARACDQEGYSAPAALLPAPPALLRRPTPPRACKPAQWVLVSAPQLAGHSREHKARSPHSPINLLLGVVDGRPFAARPHHAAPWRQSPAPCAVPDSQLGLQSVRGAGLTEISCVWPAVAHSILKDGRQAGCRT